MSNNPIRSGEYVVVPADEYDDWMDEPVRVDYCASDDGYQELWTVRCLEHGRVSIHGDGLEAWQAKRQHDRTHSESVEVTW